MILLPSVSPRTLFSLRLPFHAGSEEGGREGGSEERPGRGLAADRSGEEGGGEEEGRRGDPSVTRTQQLFPPGRGKAGLPPLHTDTM